MKDSGIACSSLLCRKQITRREICTTLGDCTIPQFSDTRSENLQATAVKQLIRLCVEHGNNLKLSLP
jgi:hypothetical protein